MIAVGTNKRPYNTLDQLDEGATVPPIDQGYYGPQPGTDPTAPPPITPPTASPAPREGKPVEEQPADPQTFNTLPARLTPPDQATVDPSVAAPPPSNPTQPEQAAPVPGNTDDPKTPVQPDGLPTTNPNEAPPIADNTPSPQDDGMAKILATNAATQATQVPTSNIDTENGLIGQQVLPSEGERFKRLRDMQDAQLNKVANGPDRFALAKDRFSQFEKETAPEYDLNRKKALSDAAAYGYTGSGRLVTQYGDLDLARERDMDSQRSRLFNTALDSTVEDNRKLLDTLHGFTGDEATYEQGSRDETRGERGYERSLSEKALADQIENAKLQESFTQSEFNRDQDRLSAGYGKDPSAAYEQAAQQAYQEGKLSAEELRAIMEYIAMQRQQSQQPAGAGAGNGGGGGGP